MKAQGVQVSAFLFPWQSVHLECLETIAINFVTVKVKTPATQELGNASAHLGEPEPNVKLVRVQYLVMPLQLMGYTEI